MHRLDRCSRNAGLRPAAPWVLLGLPLALLFAPAAQAQFKVSSTFRNNTEAGWTITGTNPGTNRSGILTGGYGAIPNNVNDANGSGWLRLTTNLNNHQGQALYTGGSFPSTQGVTVEFDYVNWGGNGADGTTFFLYDATGTMGGNPGGSLGYCGGNGAYLGLGLDEFGNFSGQLPGVTGGCPSTSGSPGSQSDRLVLRGPASDSYRWLANAAVSGGIDSPSVTTRPTSNHLMVALIPNTPQPGYTVTVSQGPTGGTQTVLLNNVNFNYPAPANLRMGYAASTGGLNNIHEIRNMLASVPADVGIVKTVSAPRIRRGQPVTYTLAVSNNDINPVVAGNQAPTIPGTDAPDIADSFPAQVTGVSWSCVASAGSTCPANGSGNIAVTGGYSLLPGGTLTFTVTGTLANNATCNSTVTNTATVAFSNSDRFGDINTANNSSSVNFAVDCVNLSVDKTATPASFTAGGTGTYAIAVANAGNVATAGQITVTDALPAGLSVPNGAVALGGANAANWACTAASNVLTCQSNAAIAAAGSSSFSFAVNVAFAATGPLINTARVAGGGDPNCTLATPCPDSTPTSTPVVRPSVSLRLSKDDSRTSYTPGTSTIYVLNACNDTGPDPANGATITDTLPAGATLTTGWTCTGSGPTPGTCPSGGGAAGNTSISVAGIVLPVGGCVSVSVPVTFSSNPANY
ncbi:hypothetical protein GLE_4346 [Lysobacter enzymogenes]|uniref:Uncharacterized protein n=1 Tax=Lysobacter enzymogenes TaxID=69 RepID=A0A0S2DM25_LYSEN|nr:DUF11 domain-containing protein [Lysobacter enzymogenes]ALN59687.1 hypothetical protein GLE_4346 [Lysobacter enzymogenes]QCW27793.1 DUF11 domain-containing protein [Lysobacter enzymogenes]